MDFTNIDFVGYTGNMLKRVFAIASLILITSSLTAAPMSETPALTVFKQWLDAFNSGDASRISAFWQRYGSHGPGDRVEGDLRLRNMTGGMTIFRVLEDTETHVVVLMKENRGAWSESTLDLASINPPIVSGMMGHPVSPPEGLGISSRNDEELAIQIRNYVNGLSGVDAFSGAILIAHDGHIVLDQAWGLADTTKQISNTTDTQFCMAR